MIKRVALIGGAIVVAYLVGMWYGEQATYMKMLSEELVREIERAMKEGVK